MPDFWRLVTVKLHSGPLVAMYSEVNVKVGEIGGENCVKPLARPDILPYTLYAALGRERMGSRTH